MADQSSVLIRRKKIFADKNENKSKAKKKNEEDKQPRESDKKYAKAFSIILFAFSILTLISLISYTVKDEANSLTPLSELFGLLSGDEAVKFKAETTENWLGLIGAIVSYHLYNSTYGIAILGLPIFLMIFAKEIWKNYNISEKSLKNFSVYIVLSLLFCSLTAIINTSEIFGMLPKELSGNIGFFVSSFLTSIIGHFGSFVLILAVMTTTVILGTNLKVDGVINKIIAGSEQIIPKSKELIKNAKEQIEAKKDVKKNSDDKEISEEDEPAQKLNDEAINEIQKYREEKKSADSKENESEIKSKPKFRPLSIRKTSEANEESSFDDFQKEINLKKSSTEPGKSSELDKNVLAEAKEEVVKAEPNFERKMPTEQKSSNNEKDIENDLNDLVDEIDSELDDIDSLFLDNKEKAKKQIKPKLILDVEDEIVEETIEEKSSSPISTLIHDEEINYTPPKFGLLKPPVKQEGVDDEELEINARILQEKLETFKIFIENLEITPGPVVTQYAFEPAAGIKISKIESLADDLAMALKAKGIRIIAPIPGKGLVGIEIPNNNPALVTFSSVITSKNFLEKKMHLPLALGKTISGETAFTDLTKTPHLLMAGATGSGKSVGVNTVINSLLYRKLPSELKFVIIDPKKVELGQYKALKNHFIAMCPDVKNPIITDPTEAVAVLKSTVMEMEKRYDILAAAGQRNIADYNEKVREGRYKDDSSMDHREIPYIVVIVDEYADLMLTSGKEIEQPIVMLAQKARAVGIHLVLATQRPSVDVITGLIKANFPARVAYLVASKVDSRTILDTSGAEQLLGMGDMLFLPPGKPTPERIQNAFISTDEVDAICDHIGNQKGYSEPYWLPSLSEDESEGAGMIDASDRDPIFRDAASLVIQTQQGSVSLIQRRLKVGYARAGRIMDELEDAGVVGPFEGSKARQVLIESESDLEAIL